jgi:hypothetical protein
MRNQIPTKCKFAIHVHGRGLVFEQHEWKELQPEKTQSWLPGGYSREGKQGFSMGGQRGLDRKLPIMA